MSAEENRLSVKIDADMSEFDEKIDVMQERLESLKKEIAAVKSSIASEISALNSYMENEKRKASSKAFAIKSSSGDEARKVLSEVEGKMRRQAAMISK